MLRRSNATPRSATMGSLFSCSRSTAEPTYGGVACAHSTETRACNTAACATDCVTASFGAWSTCTASCGTGSQQRSRAQTEPTNGGVACAARRSSDGRRRRRWRGSFWNLYV